MAAQVVGVAQSKHQTPASLWCRNLSPSSSFASATAASSGSLSIAISSSFTFSLLFSWRTPDPTPSLRLRPRPSLVGIFFSGIGKSGLITRKLSQTLASLGFSRDAFLPPVGALQFIDFEDNCFSSEVPTVLGGVTRLRSLYLGGNLFSGRIPVSLGNLSWLEIALPPGPLPLPQPPSFPPIAFLHAASPALVTTFLVTGHH